MQIFLLELVLELAGDVLDGDYLVFVLLVLLLVVVLLHECL